MPNFMFLQNNCMTLYVWEINITFDFLQTTLPATNRHGNVVNTTQVTNYTMQVMQLMDSNLTSTPGEVSVSYPMLIKREPYGEWT